MFSSSPSTISNTISSTMASTFGPIPLHHAFTIRLMKKKFIIWHAHLFPYLWSTKLMGYFDGTIATPTKLVPSSSAAGANLVFNPACDRWYDQDQQILSGLPSSISEEILHDVVAATRPRRRGIPCSSCFHRLLVFTLFRSVLSKPRLRNAICLL